MSEKRIVIFGWASSVHIKRWGRGLSERNYRVKVISLGGDKLENIETMVFPRVGKMSYLKYLGEAKREAQKFNPDVVHVHYAGGFSIWGMYTGFKPTVVSIWGSDIENINRNYLMKKIVKRSLVKADVITTSSYYLKEQTAALESSLTDKIKVVPFGVKTLPSPFGLPDNKTFKICFIKGLREIYGLDILLKALGKIKEKNSQFVLSVAGEKDDRSANHELVKSLGLSDNVKFVGFIENDRIYEFIGSHHLMVMPSRREGFGVAALEAGACGRATIASDAGGIPEVVLDNQTGYLIPSENIDKLEEKIIKLMNDRELLKSFGDNAFKFVTQNYDWEMSLDKMCSIYESFD